MDYTLLAARAREAKKHSFSPYSRFRVGAALLTTDGRIITGCNIENSSYGLTICAERTALFKAVSEGEDSFAAIAIASDEDSFTPPCGACRQVIFELAGNIDVVLTKKNGSYVTRKVVDLLPHPFDGHNLKKTKRKKKK
jgi:cytidine deaminase